MTGRRRGETPLLDPTRPQAASHPPRGCAPRPPCGLTPRTNGAPSALPLREARRKRLAKGRKFESLRGGKAPSHSPTRPRQLDDLHNPQAPQQLHRRRFYAKEGGRPGWLAGGAGTPLKCQRNVRRGARPAPITSRVRSESRAAPGAACRRRASGRSAPGRA